MTNSYNHQNYDPTRPVISPALQEACSNEVLWNEADRQLPREVLTNTASQILAEIKAQSLQYHNHLHTIDVIERAAVLSSALLVSPAPLDRQMLQIAALMHDYGHAGKPKRQQTPGVDRPDLSNEEYAALKADEIFAAHISVQQRLLLQRLILATTYYDSNEEQKVSPYRPLSDLEKVLALADLGTFDRGFKNWFRDSLLVLAENSSLGDNVSGPDFIRKLSNFIDKIDHRLSDLKHLLYPSIITEIEERLRQGRRALQRLASMPQAKGPEAAAMIGLEDFCFSDEPVPLGNSHAGDSQTPPAQANAANEQNFLKGIPRELGRHHETATDPYTSMVMLQGMYLFRNLTLGQLEQIRRNSKIISTQSGQTLTAQGNPGREMYIILSGHVDVYRDGVCVNHLNRGQHFGEMALLTRAPRSATVITGQMTRLLVIQRDQFLDLTASDATMGVRMLHGIACQLSLRISDVTAELSEHLTVEEARR